MEVKITSIKPNGSNPRIIKESKYQKLIHSVTQSPTFMTLNPVKVDEDNMILGGNMRYRVCKELGWKKVPVAVFTRDMAEENNKSRDNPATYEEQCREYIIKDNVSYGENNWDTLANEWDAQELDDWGLDVWQQPVDVDYDILDDDDVSDQLNDMTSGVKKAIQIEFEAEHYEEAAELVKFWRGKEAYIGGMIMEYLKAEKEKL